MQKNATKQLMREPSNSIRSIDNATCSCAHLIGQSVARQRGRRELQKPLDL